MCRRDGTWVTTPSTLNVSPSGPVKPGTTLTVQPTRSFLFIDRHALRRPEPGTRSDLRTGHQFGLVDSSPNIRHCAAEHQHGDPGCPMDDDVGTPSGPSGGDLLRRGRMRILAQHPGHLRTDPSHRWLSRCAQGCRNARLLHVSHVLLPGVPSLFTGGGRLTAFSRTSLRGRRRLVDVALEWEQTNVDAKDPLSLGRGSTLRPSVCSGTGGKDGEEPAPTRLPPRRSGS